MHNKTIQWNYKSNMNILFVFTWSNPNPRHQDPSEKWFVVNFLVIRKGWCCWCTLWKIMNIVNIVYINCFWAISMSTVKIVCVINFLAMLCKVSLKLINAIKLKNGNFPLHETCTWTKWCKTPIINQDMWQEVMAFKINIIWQGKLDQFEWTCY